MKGVKLLFTLLVAALLLLSLYGCDLSKDVPIVGTQAIGPRPQVPYVSHTYQEETADAWLLLIDLSDNTGYPHANTTSIILRSLEYDGDLTQAMKWKIQAGVVVSTGTEYTGIEWIHTVLSMRAAQFSNEWVLPEHGLNLLVRSEDLVFVASDQVTVTAIITSATPISSTVAWNAQTVGVGDLILFTDEVTDTAVLHLGVCASYDTE